MNINEQDLDTRLEPLKDLVKSPNRDIKRIILREAMSTSMANLDRLDLKMIASASRELRVAFDAFKSYRGKRKATVFGSARTPPTDSSYLLAKDLGSQLAGQGWLVITGGGPGIMDAAATGAGTANAFGVNIRLPLEEAPSSVLDPDGHIIEMKYFFTRKVLMIKESDAFVSMPGGLGTLDETFELLTLMQTGKTQLAPLVLLEPEGYGYFDHFEGFMFNVLIPQGLMSKSDLYLYRRASTAERAVAEIVKFYSNYHSARIVGDRLVLRLSRAPSSAELRELNHEFGDIVSDGQIEKIRPTAWELREQDHVDLDRLSMSFDNRSLGRLRLLIDRLNSV